MRRGRSRRIKIEWLKAKIAFVIFLLSVAGVDSNFYIASAAAILSLLYFRIVAIRLEKRGEF